MPTLQPEEIGYNARAGRYFYRDTKRFVPNAVIQTLVDREEAALGVRLQGLTRLLAGRKITLQDWQTRFAETLKLSHIRMAALAAGGKEGLTAAHYGAVGFQLRQQYGFLGRFAQAIADGTISEARALQRSRQYARSIRVSFGRSQQLTKGTEGFTQARRTLDAQARHCGDCVRYAALGWTLSEMLPTPGMACACGQQCRCSIFYRKR
jgi:hypothetical protein